MSETTVSPDVDDPAAPVVGVGPRPLPWPSDDRLDPELLADGDRRNVIDRYHYWKLETVVADLDLNRLGLHMAIQNWERGFNIGSIVCTANAFNVGGVYITGERHWNWRGAMITDHYLHVHHHETEESLFGWLGERGIEAVGADNLPGSVPLETAALPRDVCLVFGSEGPGLTPGVVMGYTRLVAITQRGSTRSLNAGVAAAIIMYHWALQHPVVKPLA